MASTSELIEAICILLARPDSTIPITLTNHPPELAREILVRVVERAAAKGLSIAEVAIDPQLAAEMNLEKGAQVSQSATTTVNFVPGLGRQLRFRRATH
jgi:hypothetical protein